LRPRQESKLLQCTGNQEIQEHAGVRLWLLYPSYTDDDKG